MKWHRTDRVSLGFGLFFLVVAAVWVIVEVSRLDANAATWSAVCGLFIVGLLGIAGIAAAARRRHTDDPRP